MQCYMHRFHTIFREGKPVTETSCCEINAAAKQAFVFGTFLGDGAASPSHQLRIWRSAVSSPSSSGAEPRLLKGFLAFQRHQTAGLSWGCLGPSLGVHGLLAPLKSGAAIQYLFGFFEPTRVCSQTASRSTEPFLCGRDQHTDRPHHAVCTL